MLNRPAAVIACSLLVFGCADDDTDSNDTKVGWRSTSSALSTAMAKVSVEVGDSQQGEAALAVDGAYDCTGGGSVSFTGSFGGTDDFSFDVVLDGCTALGVSTTGELSYRASVDVEGSDGQASARVESTYEGHLTWTGKVEGSCSIDAAFVVAVAADTGMTSASIEATGHLCGHDASIVAGT